MCGLTRQPGDLALAQDSRPEQDEPLVVAHLVGVPELVDDAGSLREVGPASLFGATIWQIESYNSNNND
jgi:hypothetical protein